MFKKISYFTFTILFSYQVSAATLVDNFKSAIEKKDYLAVRIIVKKMSLTNVSFQQWYTVKKILQKTPQVGFNTVLGWEAKFKEKFSDKLAIEDALLSLADKQMLVNKFSEAFVNYQKALIVINAKDRGKTLLSQMIYHRMARALYGAGRFAESLQVYDWIGNDYIFLRQIIFERTWAAFRANKIERTLGLIVSQHSPRIRVTMEPEIFLMQFYIYKRLCRDEEAKKVIEELNSQINYFKTRVSWLEWAKSDIENLWLLKILDSPNSNNFGISLEERKKEREKISNGLKAEFQREKNRLQAQAEHMLAYMNLAVEQTPKVLLKIEKLPDKEKLLNSGLNIWTSEKAEDWSDELGLHYFVGESLCK